MWVIGFIILAIILFLWYTQYDVKKIMPVMLMPQPSASESAAAKLMNAEAPKTDGPTSSNISAGTAGGSTVAASAVVTTTTPSDIPSTTVTKVTSSVTASAPSAPSTVSAPSAVSAPTAPSAPTPTVPPPIVPTAPVTSVLATPPSATASQLSAILPTYNFFPGMTFGGNDLTNAGLSNDIPKLSAWCDANVACKGFTTDGWMKSTIIPQEKWYKWSDDTTKGLYVKK